MSLNNQEPSTDIGNPGLIARPPSDYEPSANDYHKFREQDQSLNEAAMQLADLERLPWNVCGLQQGSNDTIISLDDMLGKDNQGLPSRGILAIIRMVTAISKPLASAGEYRKNSGKGSVYYVAIGQSKIPCRDPEHRDRVTRDVNAATADILLPARRAFLRIIHDHATGVAKADSSEYGWCAYAGLQECAVTKTRREAQDLVEKLNGIYLAAIDETRTRLLAQIAKWAATEIETMTPATAPPNDPG